MLKRKELHKTNQKEIAVEQTLRYLCPKLLHVSTGSSCACFGGSHPYDGGGCYSGSHDGAS